MGWVARRLKKLLLQSDNVLAPPNLAQQLTSAYKENDIVRFLLFHNNEYRLCESKDSTELEQGPWGEQWERVGDWTQGEKRGRVSGVLRAPLPVLAQEDP
eukprot:423464-Pyramimonas_sp.AAC.1